MGFGDFDLKRGLAGAFAGQGGIAAYDNANVRNQVMAQKQAQLEKKDQKDAQTEFEDLLFDTVTYVRQTPADPQSRTLAAKEYWNLRGGNPKAMEAFEQSGFLQDLSDQKLDAVISSRRSEQVLKSDEVLVGSNGQPIYENRPNEVLTDGSQLANGAGDILADNPKDFAPQATPTSIQEYNLAKQQGFKGSIADYQMALKKAGSSSVNVHGAKPSVAENSMDKLAGEEAYNWLSGGAADSAKQITQLSNAIGVLNSDEKVTGVFEGNAPDALLAIFAPEAKEVRDNIAEVVQRNLRVILGAQFTEKEGKALIERAFDPKLPQQTQAKRVAGLMKQMQLAHEAKSEMARYIQENRSLRGYEGKLPTMADFNESVDIAGATNSSMSGNIEALPNGRKRYIPN